MDALATLLDGPRARGAFLLRSVLTPPWSVQIADLAPLTLVHMVRGDAWIRTDDGQARLLRAGGIAVIRGPEPYVIAGDRETEPQIVIRPGQVSTDADGNELCEQMDLGVRTWGDNPHGAHGADGAGSSAAEQTPLPAVMISGTYQMRGEVSSRLLSALPQVLVLAQDAWSSPLPALLSEEIVRDEPGQEVVLDRLLDLLLIAVLRTWFARPEAKAPAWYAAQGDPVVGPALR
ncbi:cupin domain-containing protein, partial [Streptomyces spiralis]